MRIPVQRRPGVGTSLGSQQRGLDALERWPPGRWVYVGDYPTDPDTTPESPPFENGWTNAGGGDRRLRFRRTNEWQTEIAGSVTGGTPGTVVTTLPDLYRITETEYAATGTSAVDVAIWRLTPNGELTYLGSLVTGGAGSDTTAIHYDVVNSGGSLTINTTGGNAAFNTGVDDFTVDAEDINLSADDDFLLSADDRINMTAVNQIQAFIGDLGWRFAPNVFEIYLASGDTFTIYNFNGDPIFQMTDGSPDIHIPTGGSIIADL